MALIDSFDLAADPEFLKRVQAAIVKVAIIVQAEDPAQLEVTKAQPDPVALHHLRSVLAYNVLNEPLNYARLFALAVATDESAAKEISDEIMLALVEWQWNAFSVRGA